MASTDDVDVEMAIDETPTPKKSKSPSKKPPSKSKSASGPPKPLHKRGTWVTAPSSPEDLGSHWTEETSTARRLLQFIARWPPSRTPCTYGEWITVYRGGTKEKPQNLEGLKADFEALVDKFSNNSGNSKGNSNKEMAIKHAELDAIAKANNVLRGKWMIFVEPAKVDMLWGKVAHWLIMDRKRGVAKVSTAKVPKTTTPNDDGQATTLKDKDAEEGDAEKHVIEVYVDDFTDKDEVDNVRKKLKALGVKWKCGFKPEAYSYLDIYQGNQWNIKPSRYSE